MKFKCIIEYEYPVEHKPPVKAEIVLHGDRVTTDKIVPYKDRPQWIPITYRPMDEEEYRAFNEEYGYLPVEERKVLDCQMPEDGQEILISTKYGHIFLDACVYEDGIYGLEEYGGWDDVLAWMPIPEPYNGGEVK